MVNYQNKAKLEENNNVITWKRWSKYIKVILY